ncbi:Na-translocating system protein MpsC family protein [Pradoshia sp.]
MDKISAEKEISSYIGGLLRENFGRGPGHVLATLAYPFLAIHLSNFLSPMEKSLMANNKSIYVHKTRDLMMETLMKDINSHIELTLNLKVCEFFYDWNLECLTGMFIIRLEGNQCDVIPYQNKEKVEEEMIKVSSIAQKAPEVIYSRMLNKRQLILVRKGILIRIEKEFINLGFKENLMIAKRNLEKRLLKERRIHFEEHLNRKIIDEFTFWDFKEDSSYIILILES